MTAEILSRRLIAKGTTTTAALTSASPARVVAFEVDRHAWPDKGSETARATLFAREASGKASELCSATFAGGAVVNRRTGAPVASHEVVYKGGLSWPAGTEFFVAIEAAEPLETAVRCTAS